MLDDLLRLCDPQRLTRLIHHLLCALLYYHEIAALVDGTPSGPEVPAKIQAHLRLILTNSGYKAAYYAPAMLADWAGIEQFFYSGLEHPEEMDQTQY